MGRRAEFLRLSTVGYRKGVPFVPAGSGCRDNAVNVDCLRERAMVCHNRPLAKQSSASNSGRGGLRFHIILLEKTQLVRTRSYRYTELPAVTWLSSTDYQKSLLAQEIKNCIQES
jgi:hypothetical protein